MRSGPNNGPVRDAWLAGIKVGAEVMAHDRFSPPRAHRVVFVDHNRIFYGDESCQDWVWLDSGQALVASSSHRWIEPPI